MRRVRYPLLTGDQLNRATLARQLLLSRSRIRVSTAIERLAGLQAQEPASPYLALWTRLDQFDPATLDRAFRERRVIKASLMRATLHAVSRRDYFNFLSAMQPMLRGLNRRERGGGPSPRTIRDLAEAALAFASEPRTNIEIREHLAGLVDGLEPDDALWWVRRHGAFVHAPSGVTWSYTRRPTLVAAQAWLRDGRFVEEDSALEWLTRSYLRAFGPATAADLSAWSGRPAAVFAAAIASLDARTMLRRFSDDRGRVLLDLAQSPIPDGAVDAPPRLLPMWDSMLLAYADRSRVMADEHRRVVIAANGDTLPTFLVNGRVAGLWWAEPDGPAARIVLEPFGPVPRATRRALDEEGERLAAFVAPHEPAVYARYRRSRARRPLY